MLTIKHKHKRAFTLTELLIVVIVIGVLSAVTLPKFNRVIENRKVTEAEEMMSAVRTEQERRCSLDQDYTMNFSSLSDVISSANTKNYTYSLQSQGISAKSTSGDYTLKILSYEDGSYCCTGAGCKKLNKNYPDCATLSFPTSNCAGTEGGGGETGTDPGETPECTDGEVKGSQACNGCGTQTTQKCVGGKWTNVLGTCSKTAEECAPKPQCPTKPADVVKQCECGTVTATHKCDASTNYTWVQEAFPACPTKPADVTETCSDGKTVRTKTFTCVNNVWTPGNWDKECPAEETCLISQKYLGYLGKLTAAQIAAKDTCDGKLEVRFDTKKHNLSKGQSCIDVVQTGSWEAPSVEGKWTTSTVHPYRNYWWSGTDNRMGSFSNCLTSVRDKVWGSNSLPDATEMCKLQCPNVSHGEMNCNTNPCVFHYNCVGANGGDSWRTGYDLWGYVSLPAINCLEQKLTCSPVASSSVVSTVGYEFICE